MDPLTLLERALAQPPMPEEVPEEATSLVLADLSSLVLKNQCLRSFTIKTRVLYRF